MIVTPEDMKSVYTDTYTYDDNVELVNRISYALASSQHQYTGSAIMEIGRQTFQKKKLTMEEITHVINTLIPSAYLLRNHSIRGKPMTFYISGHDSSRAQAHRPWQMQIIDDMHPNKIVMKSRQLGLSELGVAELIWFADVYSHAGVKCLYTFPTQRQMEEFVKSRLNPVLEKGYYASIVDQNKDSLKNKKIRDTFMFFRTSSKGAAVEGVDIDYLSMDEYDRVPSSAEISARESMSSSPYKIRRRWSTPTIPNYGIHSLFEESDQHHYLHKCDSCNHWNQMNFVDNIEVVDPEGKDSIARTVKDGSYRFICSKCGKGLDRWYNGAWVPKYPERTRNGDGTRGYFISQLNAVWVSADDLHRKQLEAKSNQQFYNYVLGMPYQETSLEVKEKDILNNMREDIPEAQTSRNRYRYISVGIDWGNRHWVVVRGMRDGGAYDIINLFSVDKSQGVENIEADFQEIIMRIAPYKPNIILADIGDSGNYVDKLVQHFGKGKVYGVKVNSNARSNGQTEPIFNEGRSQVQIDKLTENKQHISDMKMGRMGFYRDMDQHLKLFTEHWQNVVIRYEEDDKNPDDLYQIITRKGDDHLAQASVYAKVGMEQLVDPQNKDTRESFGYTWINNRLPGNDGNSPGDIFGN